MYQVSYTELLNIWEDFSSLTSFERINKLLLSAVHGLTQDSLMKLTVGERNFHLFNLRKILFGKKIDCLTNCSQCEEKIEFSINTDMFKTKQLTDEQMAIRIGKNEFRFRLINCGDLMLAAKEDDLDSAEKLLIKQCIEAVNGQYNRIAINELPSELIKQLAEYIQHADPNADILINLSCPNCQATWKSEFNIADFLWNELVIYVKKLLNEVAILAHAYGWSESEILALSNKRRTYYLERVSA